MGTGLRAKLKDLTVTAIPEPEIEGIEGTYWNEKTRAGIEHLVAEINETRTRQCIAIVAAQGGGKNILLEELRDSCVRRSSVYVCKPGVLKFDIAACEDTNVDVIFVEECQQLFSRRIGGYEGLQEFLEWVAITEKTVVTSWNLFSWHYLLEAVKVSDYFPIVYEIPSLAPKEITELLLGKYGKDVEYIDDDKKRRIGLKFKSYEVETGKGGRTFHARLPTLRTKKRGETKEGREAREAVAKDIAELSYGYPGVAFGIFDACFSPPQFHTGNLSAVRVTVNLNFKELFLLLMILGHQTNTYNELLLIAQDKKLLDLALFKMQQQGYVANNGEGVYSLNMIMMYSVVERLKKARLVW
jgi:hypothetical protein